MSSIGRGAEAGRMFCALMNLPQPPTRYAPYNKIFLNYVKLVSEETMQKATQEAVWKNGSNKNIAVAVDGTCNKVSYKKYCKRNFEGSSGSMEVEVFGVLVVLGITNNNEPDTVIAVLTTTVSKAGNRRLVESYSLDVHQAYFPSLLNGSIAPNQRFLDLLSLGQTALQW
ncbi:uncharacterized protein NPIL_370911 [Nephila pilipes]|uniref:Uncharacterized protein n=1 Tax=Nephila pilipes TaxID=299642 RepID=A0A8X6PX94_NEPPI|nr:uncharacterized protein NPIL_370911 [Nephila pilipes]